MKCWYCENEMIFKHSYENNIQITVLYYKCNCGAEATIEFTKGEDINE